MTTATALMLVIAPENIPGAAFPGTVGIEFVGRPAEAVVLDSEPPGEPPEPGAEVS